MGLLIDLNILFFLLIIPIILVAFKGSLRMWTRVFIFSTYIYVDDDYVNETIYNTASVRNEICHRICVIKSTCTQSFIATLRMSVILIARKCISGTKKRGGYRYTTILMENVYS